MNIFVILFFLHIVVATLLLGYKFIMRRNDGVFKNFGIALLLDAVAFLAWSFGVMMPDYLLVSVTVGAIIFLVSLVFLFYTSIEKIQESTTRWSLVALSIVAVCGIFYIGRYVEPAHAYLSPEGLFFFGLGPLVQMLYIFALALASLPAIDLLASKFSRSYSALVRYGFIAEVVGGIMLITSKDVNVLYITGWVIGLVYFVLWTTLVFGKKAWSNN